MIEIIRQEENEKKRRTLPKDIRQIGKTDAGDRIYIENQVYHFLHTPGQEEKSAHVLLGRFEEISGKCCVFIESAIRLTEMQFEGGLPLWTDRTWAYIYKHISKEHDEMSIVGCAVDIRGQQPGMTVKLEAIHQKNFGGPHQVMLLMDTLEQEESFYGNYNGHLYKREGFYIYYDKDLPENISMSVHEASQESGGDREAAGWTMEEREGAGDRKQSEAAGETQEISAASCEAAERAHKIGQNGREPEEGKPNIKKRQRDTEASWEEKKEDELPEAHREEEPEAEQGRWEAELLGRRHARGQANQEIRVEELGGRSETRDSQSSRYRERLKPRTKKRPAVSYAPTVALAALVCLMGAAALQNQKKVNEMQSSMVHSSSETVADGQQGQPENNVVIETVGGNVVPQEDAVAQGAENMATETMPIEPAGTEATSTDTVGDGQTEPTADLAENVPGEPNETAATQTQETTAAETQATETMADDTVKTEAQIYLEQGYYIVQKGDNLAGICRKIYKTTAMMDKICELNKIEDKDAIYAGQYLVLPN